VCRFTGNVSVFINFVKHFYLHVYIYTRKTTCKHIRTKMEEVCVCVCKREVVTRISTCIHIHTYIKPHVNIYM